MSAAKNKAAVALGRLGGKAKTARKAEASRANGRKGGRPKKKPTEEGAKPPANALPVRCRDMKLPNNNEAESLANDLARCDGVGFQEDDGWDWREGCETCLRRTAPRPEYYSLILPPPIIAFECEYLIEPSP